MFDPEYTISLYFNGSEALTQGDIDQLSDWISESEENAAKFVQASFMHRGIYDSLTGEVTQKNALFDLMETVKSDSKVLVDSNTSPRGVDVEEFMASDDQADADDSEEALDLLEILELVRTSPAVEIEKPKPVKVKPELIQKVESDFKWFPGRPSRRMTRTFLAIAACIMVFIGYLHFFVPDYVDRPYVATLADSINAVWDDDFQMPDEYGEMVQSRYRLKEGYASILFTGGAKVTVESPAELSLNSAGDMELFGGKIYAVVPDRANGFTVTAGDNKIVDLGTEFGVEVNTSNNTELHVTKGETLLYAGSKNNNKPPYNVDAGAAKKVYNDGFVKDIPLVRRQFVRAIDSKIGSVFRVLFAETFDPIEERFALTPLNHSPKWLKFMEGSDAFVCYDGTVAVFTPKELITPNPSVVRPFEPEVNKVYTVSLDVTNPTAGSIGLGFCRQDFSHYRYSHSFESSGIGWMRYGHSNPPIAAYSGVDADSKEYIQREDESDGLKAPVAVTGGVHKAGPTKLMVELDTTGDGSMFKVTFFQDGIKVAGPVSIPSKYFHHVGFSYMKSGIESENDDGILLDNFIISVRE